MGRELYEGSLYRGVTNSAGEWGHTKIVLGGRPCRCGSKGCLEAYVGAPGIIRTLNEMFPKNNIFVEGDQISTIENLLSAAKLGDNLSKQVLLMPLSIWELG